MHFFTDNLQDWHAFRSIDKRNDKTTHIMTRTRLYGSGEANYFLSGTIHNYDTPIVHKPAFKKVYSVFDHYDEENDKDDYTLRAVKILGVCYTSSHSNSLLKVKVAGLGEGYINLRDAYLYASKEDYTNGKFITTNEFFGSETFNYFEAIKDSGVCSVTHYDNSECVTRYGWKENNITSTIPTLYVYYDAVLDTFKVTLHPRTATDYPYATKEEAIADNELSVCEFDDDEEKPSVYNLDVTISATIKVSAKNLSDANYKVLEMVKGTNFANYHCVKTSPKE